MLLKNLKLNVILLLLVGILLTSANGCGGDGKGKEDKDYAKKQEKVLEWFQGMNPPPAVKDAIEKLIKKLGDSSVSAEQLEKFIKEIDDNEELNALSDSKEGAKFHKEGEQFSQEGGKFSQEGKEFSKKGEQTPKEDESYEEEKE